MALTFLIVFWIFLLTISCQPTCVPETLDDADFYIDVTEHIQVQSIDCIHIPYNVIFPRDKVTVPYKMMLFKGNPSNVVDTKVISDMRQYTKDAFYLNELPRGEYKFGIKLEWYCNQTYVFPKRIQISVSATTIKPNVLSYPMVEGRRTQLICTAPMSCSCDMSLVWKWTNANGKSSVLDKSLYDDTYMPWYDRFPDGSRHRPRYRPGKGGRNHLSFYPTAEHHNTNITCVAEYDHDTTETSVTLTVTFSPRILNSSHCTVKGELLVCVCISWGNPLPPILWPLENLTDYSVTTFRNDQRVNSSFTTPAAKYHSSTVECISSNQFGQAAETIPIRNSTEDVGQTSIPDSSKGFNSALGWLTGVSFTLNLVLIAVIVCVYQNNKKKQKEPCEGESTYAALRKADVEEEYSVILPQSK